MMSCRIARSSPASWERAAIRNAGHGLGRTPICAHSPRSTIGRVIVRSHKNAVASASASARRAPSRSPTTTKSGGDSRSQPRCSASMKAIKCEPEP